MKKPQEALQEILQRVRPLSTELVDILETSGRVAAEEVAAARDLPPWDNSAMDGYAVHVDDVRDIRKAIPVALNIAAGADVGALPPGHAARIMTGAPVPEGADAVIMREEVDESVAEAVVLKRAPGPGENIRRRGDDVKSGATVVRTGQAITPADIGLVVSVGRSRLRVRRRPIVAILSTGDELSEPGDAPHPSRIVNANAWMLAAQVREAGGIPRLLGIAKDTRESLLERLRDAERADVLLTIGGVSVGDYDFVKEALETAGARLAFWKVAIRPGKPLAVGDLGETLVFGLPGNPVSSFVTFEVFVRPALLAMQGHAATGRRVVKARVAGSYSKKPGLTHFVRAELVKDTDGTIVVKPRKQQSSGALTSIAGANGLLVLDEERGNVQDGDIAPVLVLNDLWERS